MISEDLNILQNLQLPCVVMIESFFQVWGYEWASEAMWFMMFLGDRHSTKTIKFLPLLWNFILWLELVRGPQWCRAPFRACWLNSQSFCVVDIGPGYLLWQLLIKIEYVCPSSPSPHFYSLYFPLIPPKQLGDWETRKGHKFTEPLQARSSSEAHFSSFYLKSAVWLCNYTQFQWIHTKEHCVHCIVELFYRQKKKNVVLEKKNHLIHRWRWWSSNIIERQKRKTASTALNMK